MMLILNVKVVVIKNNVESHDEKHHDGIEKPVNYSCDKCSYLSYAEKDLEVHSTDAKVKLDKKEALVSAHPLAEILTISFLF